VEHVVDDGTIDVGSVNVKLDELWTATRYCPPIDLRKELLGVSDDVAAEQLALCQRRVAEANDANVTRPARP
jgi:hypothetical protein